MKVTRGMLKTLLKEDPVRVISPDRVINPDRVFL